MGAGFIAPRPLAGVAFKSHPVFPAAQHRVAFSMLSSDTRAMGLFADVVWYDFNATPVRGRWAFVTY